MKKFAGIPLDLRTTMGKKFGWRWSFLIVAAIAVVFVLVGIPRSALRTGTGIALRSSGVDVDFMRKRQGPVGIVRGIGRVGQGSGKVERGRKEESKEREGRRKSGGGGGGGEGWRMESGGVERIRGAARIGGADSSNRAEMKVEKEDGGKKKGGIFVRQEEKRIKGEQTYFGKLKEKEMTDHKRAKIFGEMNERKSKQTKTFEDIEKRTKQVNDLHDALDSAKKMADEQRKDQEKYLEELKIRRKWNEELERKKGSMTSAERSKIEQKDSERFEARERKMAEEDMKNKELQKAKQLNKIIENKEKTDDTTERQRQLNKLGEEQSKGQKGINQKTENLKRNYSGDLLDQRKIGQPFTYQKMKPQIGKKMENEQLNMKKELMKQEKAEKNGTASAGAKSNQKDYLQQQQQLKTTEVMKTNLQQEATKKWTRINKGQAVVNKEPMNRQTRFQNEEQLKKNTTLTTKAGRIKSGSKWSEVEAGETLKNKLAKMKEKKSYKDIYNKTRFSELRTTRNVTKPSLKDQQEPLQRRSYNRSRINEWGKGNPNKQSRDGERMEDKRMKEDIRPNFAAQNETEQKSIGPTAMKVNQQNSMTNGSSQLAINQRRRPRPNVFPKQDKWQKREKPIMMDKTKKNLEDETLREKRKEEKQKIKKGTIEIESGGKQFESVGRSNQNEKKKEEFGIGRRKETLNKVGGIQIGKREEKSELIEGSDNQNGRNERVINIEGKKKTIRSKQQSKSNGEKNNKDWGKT